MSDISTRPLAQVSVKSVRQVQILDHSSVWWVQFSSPRNYLKITIKNDFTLHFGKKIPKHKPTISTLRSFVFRKASDVLHSAKHDGLWLAKWCKIHKVYIYSHSTTKFTFKKYSNSRLTTCFLFTNIFTHIYEMYSFTFNSLYSFTFTIKLIIQHFLCIAFAHSLVPAPAT